MLAGFSRRIDRAVLDADSGELADESPRERLFDVLMSRLEAMAPYRDAIREISAWLRREARRGARGMNEVVDVARCASCSRRPGLRWKAATGGLSSLQGLALAWYPGHPGSGSTMRSPGTSKTMAELDRSLTRGERIAANVDRLSGLAAPFTAFAQAALDAGRRARARRPGPARKDDGEEAASN